MITVVNVGHNLFDIPSDELLERIDAFMNGRPVATADITVDLPSLVPPVRAH